LGQAAVTALAQMDMVVTLSPFKTNLECSHVLLPIAPFTETAGTFINAEARVQSFYAVTKPHGLARPAWKVLRVLGDLMGLLVSGFEAETIEQVRSMALAGLAQDEESWGALSEGPRSVFTNFSNALLNLENPVAAPCSASIYQLDSLVRRSPVLQATVDAQMGMKGVAQ
jgi:NADH-quinone oxidoreductase subunit G